MMPRSKLSATSHVLAYSDSWEEQAFAEDSAGHLGGCIWPPRSYSCSFCGREFSSAQALGGHMNVHRRERARLKESTNQCQKPSPVLRQYPSQVCTLVYNSNPNFVDATLPPPGVLLPSTQDDCSEQGFPFLSSIIQEQPKVSSQSLSLGSSNSNIERENFGVGEMGCRVPKEFAKRNFAFSSSDSITHRSRMSDSGGEEEEAISSKRQKKGSSSPLLIQGERGGTFRLFPFLMTSGLGGRRIRPSGVLGQGAESSDDLDLELRLGDRPKV